MINVNIIMFISGEVIIKKFTQFFIFFVEVHAIFENDFIYQNHSLLKAESTIFHLSHY